MAGPRLIVNLRTGAEIPVKVYFAQIFAQLFVQNFNKIFPKMLDFYIRMWYYNSVKRENDERLREGLLKEIKVI